MVNSRLKPQARAFTHPLPPRLFTIWLRRKKWHLLATLGLLGFLLLTLPYPYMVTQRKKDDAFDRFAKNYSLKLSTPYRVKEYGKQKLINSLRTTSPEYFKISLPTTNSSELFNSSFLGMPIVGQKSNQTEFNLPHAPSWWKLHPDQQCWVDNRFPVKSSHSFKFFYVQDGAKAYLFIEANSGEY